MWKNFVPLLVVMLFVALVAHRVWRSRHIDLDESMGAGLTEDAERALYAFPAGRYTQSDIVANGSEWPSRRYRGFKARHELVAQPGEMLCPISRTKANPACTWVIGGRTYLFCCPPCIDELVRLAREQPDQLQPPEAFRKRSQELGRTAR